MKKNETTKKTYESPLIEVTEFSLEDSIATSGLGASLFEQVWGGGGGV